LRQTIREGAIDFTRTRTITPAATGAADATVASPRTAASNGA
jgi:hypothetical protein